MSDWNAKIIEEFRTNGGKVGGMFEGWPLLLLHHTGAKTGTERVTPLVFQDAEPGVAIFASKGGHHSHPHWYLNVKANPDVTVDFGDRTVEMTAREVTGAEREPIWERQKADRPNFAEYEQNTDRQIPVIILEPR